MWNAVSAIAAIVAALGAIAAVAYSIQQQRDNHRRALLKDRLDQATMLLTAFEVLASFVRADAARSWMDLPSVDPEGRAQATAEFAARLQASAENLPINQGTLFGHWPFGTVDENEKAYLRDAPAMGDPEQDGELTMKQRAEIVNAVHELRSNLNADRISKQAALTPRRDAPPSPTC